MKTREEKAVEILKSKKGFAEWFKEERIDEKEECIEYAQRWLEEKCGIKSEVEVREGRHSASVFFDKMWAGAGVYHQYKTAVAEIILLLEERQINFER